MYCVHAVAHSVVHQGDGGHVATLPHLFSTGKYVVLLPYIPAKQRKHLTVQFAFTSFLRREIKFALCWDFGHSLWTRTPQNMLNKSMELMEYAIKIKNVNVGLGTVSKGQRKKINCYFLNSERIPHITIMIQEAKKKLSCILLPTSSFKKTTDHCS